MRILEVRDGFIKFESDENVALSSFIQVGGFAASYIAQIVKVTKSFDKFLAYAKIIFLYDGSFRSYDNSLPDKNAEIEAFSFETINCEFEANKPIIAGTLIESDHKINLDKECFNKKVLISVENNQTNNNIVANLTNEFSKYAQTVIIDMFGVINAEKYTAGVDFKLPLNTSSLEFMYEDCLNDATAESKSLIKEIFSDLAEYSKTVPFLPFSTLKTIVDDMVEKSHIFKLLVLKNKLAKFDRAGYFASTSQEAENLDKILNNKIVIIDLSKLDSTFQNRYLSTIYSMLKYRNFSGQVLVEASNAIDKKNIKTIVTDKNISSIFVTHPRFKYINEIKSLFTNFFIEPGLINNQIFKTYTTLLTSMPKDTYLIVGEGTKYIPLVSTLAPTQINFTEISEDTANNELEEVIIVETSDNEERISHFELEEALKDPQTEAIEKKSEDLIEKVAENIEADEISSEMSLFSEEDTQDEALEEEDSNVASSENDNIVEESLEETEELPLEETVDADITGIDKEIEETEEEIEEEFHTVVDDTQTIAVPEEISEITEEIEAEALEAIDTDIEFEEEPTEELQISDEDSQEETVIEETETIEISNDELEEIIDEPTEELITEYEEDTQPIAIQEANEGAITETVEEDIEELEVIPLEDDAEAFDEIIELDESELGDNDIIVEMDSFEDDVLNKEIVEDVDKVFTTIKEDSLDESDLDFIDELNNDTEEVVTDAIPEELEEISLSENLEELPELQEEADEDGFLEPLEEINEYTSLKEEEEKEVLETRNTQTPMVPVYDADIPQEDMVMSDPIEQGDTVNHAKYGSGIVEKTIKYGTKTLYSINFDNIGRRLLDPTLTEIKKA